MSITTLVSHELGHYISARNKDLDVGWPIFFKVPFLPMELGATPIYKDKDRTQDLIEIYAWGSISSLITSSCIVLYSMLIGYPILMELAILRMIGEIGYMVWGSDSSAIRKLSKDYAYNH